MKKNIQFTKQQTDIFSYKITEKYIGENKIQIDTCVFHLDSPIPKDIEIGNFVSFEFLTSSCCI